MGAETKPTQKQQKTPPAAAEKKQETEDLGPVIVTATKTETEAWRTASSVTVIDREKIERQQYRLLAEALRDVPGMTIADRGSPGTVATVLLRGTDTEHTALLIDGRPIPPNLAGSFNLENQTLDNVERIEVLRGPAASLYGGKTIGGVINVISRSGRGLEKPETTVFFEAGSYGTFREGLSTLGAAGDLDWAFEASRTDINGQRINSGYEQTSLSGKIGYQISETLRFDLDTRYYTAEVGVPGAAVGAGANDPDNQLTTEYWSISPRLIWDTTDWWKQTLTYSYSNFRQVAANFPGGFFNPNNRITSKTHFLEYQSEFRPTDKWTITAGAWLQDQSFDRFNDSFGITDIFHTETNWAVFLQSQAEILPGLSLVTGIRHDHYSDFDDETTWRAGLAYRVPVVKTLLHANYGTAYAPPTAQDLAAVFGGNPLLMKPERSRGFEFGLEQPIEAVRANLRATYFHNDLRDTYQFPAPAFIPVPVGRARTRGVELGGDWQPIDEVRFDVAYTYLDADATDNRARLVRRPRHTISGGLTVLPHKDVTLSLSAIYVIDREDFFAAGQGDAEDYMTVRLAANWRINKHLEVFARVENLLGEEYEEVPGFPAFDTGAYAGFRLRF